MAIANVRFSLDADYGSGTTNQARRALEEAGYVNVGTGSYTGEGEMHDLVRGIDDLTNVLISRGSAPIDHLWIQIGRRPHDR
ncbi:hypothetical protein ACLQ2Q_13280 [Microbacterium sp. DT81.1]|uniref:hypothetical protein n=1 Tax=Microbacterium sp. DT81.1 TaxID=3393413 RepID=UPI003CF0E948